MPKMIASALQPLASSGARRAEILALVYAALGSTNNPNHTQSADK